MTNGTFRVSDILHHESAAWVWTAIRSGADLEQMESDNSDDANEMKVAVKYLEEAVTRLASQAPKTEEWEEKMLAWKSKAIQLWVVWWDCFNVALNAADSVREMTEW